MQKILIYLFLFCGFLNHLYAQESLKTTVIDQETGKPLPFVHAYVKDTQLGTYSNVNGRVILTSEVLTRSDSIIFSCIGFQQLSLPFGEVADTVYLTIEPLLLKQLTISAKREKFDAQQFVKAAIKEIPDNHAIEEDIVGFYRQLHYRSPIYHADDDRSKYTVAKADFKTIQYLRLIESYFKYRTAQKLTEVYQVRRSDDYRKYKYTYDTERGFAKFRLLERTNVEDPQLATEKEAAKYSVAGFLTNDPILSFQEKVIQGDARFKQIASFSYANLNDEFTKRHSFKLEEITYHEGREIYVIKILPNSKSYAYSTKVYKKHSFIPIGRLYIDSETLSFERIEYRYIQNPKAKGWLLGAAYVELGRETLYSDTYIYRRINGKMHLAFAERNQMDEIVNTDFLSELGDAPAFHYMTRQFVRSEVSDQAFDGYSSIYAPYKYNAEFWKVQNFVYQDEKEEQKIVEDLEVKGTSLLDQFKKNGISQ